MMKRLFNDNGGAALVELALTAPLLLLVMIGAVELGRVAHFAIEVQNAARAGASWGTVNVRNASWAGMVQQAAYNDAPDLPGLIVTPANNCVCETLNLTSNTATFSPNNGTTLSCSDPAITSCTGTSSTTMQTTVSYVTVSTQATLSSIFQIAKLPGSYTFNGYSSLRILSN